MTNADPTAPVGGPAPPSSEVTLTMDSEASPESRIKDPVEFSFGPNSLRVGTPYKVNVHALVPTL